MDKIKKRPWVQAPVDLFSSPLSAKAKLCYCVMGSFGSESRASLSAIAYRMTSSESTVREAQKELISSGWLRLLKEGSAGGKKGGSPREWELLEDGLKGPENITLTFSKGPENSTLRSSEDINQEKHKDKTNQDTGEPAFKDFVEAYFKAFKARTGIDPKPSGQDWASLKRLVKGGEPLDRFKKVLPTFFDNSFARERGFCLAELERSYQSHLISKGSSSGRRGSEKFYDAQCDPESETPTGYDSRSPDLVEPGSDTRSSKKGDSENEGSEGME